MNPSQTDRLLGVLTDYERTLKDLSYRLADMAQDIDLLRTEIEQEVRRA